MSKSVRRFSLGALRFAKRLGVYKNYTPPRNISSVHDSDIYQILSRASGHELGRMMTTSKRYRNIIRENPNLMRRIQNAKRNVTKKRIENVIGELNNTLFALNPVNQRRIKNYIMQGRYYTHPLPYENIRRIFFNVFH